MRHRLLLVLVAMVTALGFAAPAVSASGFSIVRPGQKFAGKTYGQWSADWWQWAAKISEPNSPISDQTGEDCAVGQKGPVWFLAGTNAGQATRSCTVPANKAILVPIINGECSTVEGTPKADLRACAVDQMDHVTATSLIVDGKEVLAQPIDNRYRFRSQKFRIEFAEDNGFGVPAGKGKAVADGFWVLLKPLAKGNHTIDIHGVAPFPEFDFTFQVDVHYDLTVTR